MNAAAFEGSHGVKRVSKPFVLRWRLPFAATQATQFHKVSLARRRQARRHRP